ncbi:MAG: hypothetical protein HRU24_14720 [Gammaproteobacteria bacterium]|nr:hypothetical protein [Gammaproteobacteria bacterium]
MKSFKYYSVLFFISLISITLIVAANVQWCHHQESLLAINKKIVVKTLSAATYQNLDALRDVLELHSTQTIELWQVTDSFGTVLMFNQPMTETSDQTSSQPQTSFPIVIQQDSDMWALGEVKKENLTIKVIFKTVKLLNVTFLSGFVLLMGYIVLFLFSRRSQENLYQRKLQYVNQQCDSQTHSINALLVSKSDLNDRHNQLQQQKIMLTETILSLHDDKDLLSEIVKQQRIGKSLFVADLCHEIKTPLTSLYAMIKKVADKDKWQQHGKIIEKNQLLLSSFLDDFIELAKKDNGKFSVNKIWCYLNVIVEEAIDIAASHNANTRDIVFTHSLTQVECLIDALRIKQICINLLTNAMKYGGNFVHLDISLDPARTDNLLLTVRDYGRGIPNDTKEKIFHAFERGNIDDNHQYQGIGLGLHIICNICHSLDATIKVYDAIPQGSIFEVRLKCEVKDLSEQSPKNQGACIAFVGNKSPVCLALSQACGDKVLIDSFVNEHSFLEHLSLEQPSYDLIVCHETTSHLTREITANINNQTSKVIELSSPDVFGHLLNDNHSNSSRLTPTIINELIGDITSEHHYRGNILLLDDTPSNILPIRQMAGNDYTIWVADNIHDAQLASNANSFSLILVDLKLFDGELGYDFITRCRLFGRNKQTVIYAYTASSVYSLLDFCILAGADNILEKPVAQYLTIEKLINIDSSLAIDVLSLTLPNELLKLSGGLFMSDISYWQRQINTFLSRENAAVRTIFDELFSYILTLTNDADGEQIIDYLMDRLHQAIN